MNPGSTNWVTWPTGSREKSTNPETGRLEKDLPSARQNLDLLAMLREKTRGNLTAEEEKLVDNLLSDLRMRYVEASRK